MGSEMCIRDSGNDVDCFAGYDAIQLLEEKVSEIMRVWCDLFSCD